MMMRSRRSGRRATPRPLGRAMALALLTSAVMACTPSASGGGTVTPGGNGAVPDGPDPQGDHQSEMSIDELRARLDELRGKQAEMASSSDASFGVCEDLCSLASNICSVKEKLCEVADRHPGEEEYQDLCRKAELECGEAEDSCVACVEAREKAGATEAAGQ